MPKITCPFCNIPFDGTLAPDADGILCPNCQTFIEQQREPAQPIPDRLFCPECGQENTPDSNFCTKCRCNLAEFRVKQYASSQTDYDYVADKVGLVPNIRKKDNLFQGAFALGGMVIFGLIGSIVSLGGDAPWWMGTIVGTLLGFIAGALISGLVLCVKGLKR